MNQPYTGFTRIACSEPCVIEDQTGSRTGILWNLSTIGAYVVLEAPLPEVGREVSLSFFLPGDETPIRASARVAWHNPPSALHSTLGDKALSLPAGCGFEFLAVETADRQRIQARVQS